MITTDSVIAIFPDHEAAEAAVRKLVAAHFDMKHLSVVGKGYHTEEKVVGFFSTGDRVKFWGSRGLMWGGLWGLFFGGLFLTVPVLGSVVVLGYLGTIIASGLEAAIVTGGIGALGAALYSMGIPKDSVINYESVIKADGFLVMAHGTPDEIAEAKAILLTLPATSIDLHEGVQAAELAAV